MSCATSNSSHQFSYTNHNSGLMAIPVNSSIHVAHHHHHSLCSSQMELRMVTIVLMGLITVTTLLALAVTETEARPSRTTGGWPEYRSLFHQDGDIQRRASKDCDSSSEVRELCQRCAKATKSKWAYPLCCEEQDTTRNFCRIFLDFGYTAPTNGLTIP